MYCNRWLVVHRVLCATIYIDNSRRITNRQCQHKEHECTGNINIPKEHLYNMLKTEHFYQFHHSNISNQTAIFDEQNEKLFLYGKLLQREHKFNVKSIERLREEIHQELGTNITNLLFVTKENSSIGSKLPYVSWKGLWNVSSKFYELLPKNSTFNRLNRCSVVGNSGSLLHSNCGRHIDEAEFVYR
ncbi:alpha-N-acetylneuraminate alpha-2,8-sialyltransferase ST8SIA3-like [Apostichopus japonicus]|uniref:alpha-N-acetylneuraminate alpha-2,8-sialyltransferase ST8SIA3-like n=1 Tax=Stichopus japonicus TaxID=307972 RepID=UPI003AB715A5